MELNQLEKNIILKAYSKTSSITGTLEIVKPILPNITEQDILELINVKVVSTQVETAEDVKKRVSKSSAKVMQGDAVSALYALQSKLVKFEKEYLTNQPEQMKLKFREICSEAFNLIKEI